MAGGGGAAAAVTGSGSLTVSQLTCGPAVVALSNVGKVIGVLENGDKLAAALDMSKLHNALVNGRVEENSQR